LLNTVAVDTAAEGAVFTVVAGACVRAAEARRVVAGLLHLLQLAMGAQGALLLLVRVSGTVMQHGKVIIFHGLAVIIQTAISGLEILPRLLAPRQMVNGIRLAEDAGPPVHSPKLDRRTALEASTFLAATAGRRRIALLAAFRDRVAKSGRILRPLETWFRNPNRFPHFIIHL
jgi:hypothetical protein